MHDSSSGISALRFLHESKRLQRESVPAVSVNHSSQGIEKYSAPVFAQVERSTSSGISALRLLHETERVQQRGGVLAVSVAHNTTILPSSGTGDHDAIPPGLVHTTLGQIR